MYMICIYYIVYVYDMYISYIYIIHAHLPWSLYTPFYLKAPRTRRQSRALQLVLNRACELLREGDEGRHGWNGGGAWETYTLW